MHHLGRLQARAAELAHDLPKGIVGKSGHGRLQHRRFHDQRADVKRTWPRAPFPTGTRRTLPPHSAIAMVNRSLLRFAPFELRDRPVVLTSSSLEIWRR